MKLGVLLSGRRPDDIAKRLEQAREAGFSLCQLNLYQTGFTRGDLAQIADAMVEYGIRPLAVGCYVNPLRPEEASAMGATRADLETLLLSLDIIGARRIVFWSGTHADALYDEDEKNAEEESLEILRSFVTDVVLSTKTRHYYLVIEPFRSHVLGSEERIITFHNLLSDAVKEKVRYVLDAPGLITPERYSKRDDHAMHICRAIGDAAGVIHLRDCIMPPDGEEELPGPGQGCINYPLYLETLHQYAHPEAPAIVRNVPASEYAEARNYLLRIGTNWELS